MEIQSKNFGRIYFVKNVKTQCIFSIRTEKRICCGQAVPKKRNKISLVSAHTLFYLALFSGVLLIYFNETMSARMLGT